MGLTTSEQLILGILAEKLRHGYEIEKVIAQRGMRSWTDIGFSSIYYLLGKLEKAELVISPASDSKSKTRKRYTITVKGISACTEATRQTLAQPQAHQPLLVGLANSPLLDSVELVQLLNERRKQSKAAVQEIEAAQQAQGQLPTFVQAIFEYNIYQLKAEAQWAQATINKLQEETMDKIDFKKTLGKLYNPKNKDWELVEVPNMQFLMIDGQGNPNTAKAYGDAVEALYSVSYPLKFMSKKTLGKDYTVAPLEGLWYADDPSVFARFEKDKYHWTMMIMQPEWITKAMVDEAIETATAKKGLPALSKLRFESYNEGQSLQLLHIGSYDDEAPKLAYLHDEYMPGHKLTFNGHHHEIYLGDPRKAAPEKLKTILRQPVKKL